jgi:hypothetical protein
MAALTADPAKNPLGNLLKLSIQEVTTPAEIIVCFGPGGPAGKPGTTIAIALHIDCKTVLGPHIHSPRPTRWRRL